MKAGVIMDLYCKFYLKTSLSRDALREMFKRDFASAPEYKGIDFFAVITHTAKVMILYLGLTTLSLQQ